MKNLGFKNEQKIIKYLQDKEFHNLNYNFKKLISKSFHSYEGIIQVKWDGVKKDIKKISKINLEKPQEINFTKELNKKRTYNSERF